MLMEAKEILSLMRRPVLMMEIPAREYQPQGIQINLNFEKTFDVFYCRI